MGNYVFRLPDVGEGIAEAEIVAWHVKVGDTVNEDAPLVDVMTDKATVEIGAPVAGKIVQRKGTEGQMSRVGDELVVIETEAGATPAPARGEQPAAKAPSGTGAPGEGRSNGARRESGETASGKPQADAQSKPQAVAVKPEPAPAKPAAGSS